MVMYRLLLLDIDGTITENDLSVSLHALETLRMVKKKNPSLKICLFSGNVLPVMMGIRNILGVGDSLMAENGGILLHEEKITKFFDREIPWKAFEKIRIDHGAREFITNRWRETSISFILDKTVDYTEYHDMFNVRIEDSGYAKHILNMEQGKGFAAKKLMELYNCDPMETISCGDGENDIGMIKITGHSGVPNNSIDLLKENAEYVSDHSYGNGLVDIFRHFSLL